MRFAACLLALCISFALPLTAYAEPQVRTESRDAALGFIGTMNFTVGRLGVECLAVVGRTETPQQLVQLWQQRNLRYVLSASKYMERMLDEVKAQGGDDRRTAVLSEVTSTSRSSGMATVASLLRGDSREESCKRALTLLDAGAFDVSPRLKMYPELEAVVEWAK